jgi:hypothetical protein
MTISTQATVFFDSANSSRESCPSPALRPNDGPNNRKPTPRSLPRFASWLEETLDLVNAGVERALSAGEIVYTDAAAPELDQNRNRR